MTQAEQQIEYNNWATGLYEFPSPYDYRIMYGGRGSSKTFETTRALIVHGHQRPMRIAVAREHKVSIEESAQPELLDRARELGLLRPDCYTATRTAINHQNGTHFFFLGLSVVSEEDIKGLAGVDILWIEEAHRMSQSSWELVYPTVRKLDAEIWLTFNPKYRTDPAWKLAQRTHDPHYWIRKITYKHNSFFTPRNDRDRLRDLEENPDRYPHVWEGEPDDVSAAKKVLPFALLRKCVEAWDKRPIRGTFQQAGFDVADTGDDKNSLAIRAGPELYHIERWHGSQDYTVGDSTRKVANLCRDNYVQRLSYDAGGLGAGVRDPIRQWMKDTNYGLAISPCVFGGAVQAGDILFIRGSSSSKSQTNAQYFGNWAAQAGMVLMMRAQNTKRLLKGEDVDPEHCLFINPEIPHLDDVLSQLAQPEWDDDSGKMRIDKKPKGPGEPEPPSPDAYDAVVLAFSRDARRGLTQGKNL